MNDKDETPCFVAYGTCGHLVACAVDEHERAADNGKEVGKWIKQGLRVEKLPVTSVRTAKWCDCKRKAKETAAK